MHNAKKWYNSEILDKKFYVYYYLKNFRFLKEIEKWTWTWTSFGVFLQNSDSYIFPFLDCD